MKAATTSSRGRVNPLLAALTVAVGMLAFPPPTAAATMVDCAGGDSLQAAISAAPPGETINLAAGQCTERIDIIKDLVLRGAGMGSTIISGFDPTTSGSTIDIFDGASVEISDLSITDGTGDVGVDTNGPGIQLTLERVDIFDHSGDVAGGVLVSSDSTVTIVDSKIRENNAGDAGGGILSFGTLLVTNTEITGNKAVRLGGGIASDGTSQLTGLTVTGNEAPWGGGIFQDVNESMTITGSVISDNTNGFTDLGGLGGGIANWPGATLTVTGTTFSNNQTIGGFGGGIFNGDDDADLGGTVTVTDSTFVSNGAAGGGGIYNKAGDLTVSDSTFEGHTSSGGGGIQNDSTGTVEITGSTFTENIGGTGGGAIGTSAGTVTVASSTFMDNGDSLAPGGAIYAGPGGTLTVSTSTFSGNKASNGGAILNEGTIDVTNSTFNGNNAAEEGGAINNFGSTLVLTHATIAGNEAGTAGGGLASGGEVALEATILTDNTAPSGADCHDSGASTFTSNGYNLIGTSTCGSSWLDTTDLGGVDPMLEPIQDNGGPTATMKPAAGSPAINAIPAAQCGTNEDQRGIERPKGPGCDIGAVEVEVQPPTVTIRVEGPFGPRSDVADIIATVSSERSITSVRFSANGLVIGTDTSSSGGWSIRWNTAGVTEGQYTLTAVATDDLGLTGTGTQQVVIDHLPDGVALFNPDSGKWNLRRPDGTAETFFYGAPGDVPLLGDWDCDGIDTVAMFRPSTGFIYLRNSNTLGFADQEFFFGIGGDIPLAGDWDGDGCDTFAIYRNSEVFIANTLGTVVAEFSYFFGIKGDRPFAGDFDGDGVTTVGLYRESTGFVYFRDSLSTGFADFEFFYGVPSDRIAAGDWDGDGDDSVGIFRPGDARFFLSNENKQGFADVEFNMGEGTWIPVAGHFEFSTDPVGPPPPRTFTGPLPAQPNLSGEVSFEVSGDMTEVSNLTVALMIDNYQCAGATVTSDRTTTLFGPVPVVNSSFSASGTLGTDWQGTFDSESLASGTVSGEIQVGGLGGPTCTWGPLSWTATPS